MSEAYGWLQIKLSESLSDKLMLDTEKISSENIALLLSEACVKLDDNSIDLNNELYVEEISRKGDYLVISLFGSSWFNFLKNIVENGRDIYLYATVYDEYGRHDYYALNSSDCYFYQSLDHEAIDSNTIDEVVDEWRLYVPYYAESVFLDLLYDIVEIEDDESDTDYFSRDYLLSEEKDKDGNKVEVVSWSIFMNEDTYDKEHLIKAIEFGGKIIYFSSVCYPDWLVKENSLYEFKSILNIIISHTEIPNRLKLKAVKDIIGLNIIDLNKCYRGNGDGDYDFATPLILAARRGLYLIVKDLIENGADASITTAAEDSSLIEQINMGEKIHKACISHGKQDVVDVNFEEVRRMISNF